jgi:plasmid stability protein
MLLAMGQIVIRNLDDAVLTALKSRAARNGTSMEEEARRALAQNVGVDTQAWMARLDALRKQLGPLPGPSSVDLLRADRARDEER